MNSKIMLNLSNEQDEAFKELKNRIENKYGLKEAEDFKIHRFLKARNFVVQKAEDMLIKHIEWKKRYKTDTILQDFKLTEVMKNYVQLNVIGFDNEGRVMVFVDAGNIDFRGILSSEKKEYILEYVTYFLIGCEKLLQEQSQKYGRPIETWNVILDVENLAISQVAYRHTIDLLLGVFSLYEANFPERLKAAHIINVSAAFFIGFNAVKPILAGTTLQKINLYGKNGYQEELTKITDPDELPAFLGGNRTDPDGNERCNTTVHHCGIIPESYYFRSTARRLCGQPEVKEYDVGRMGKVDISFNVVQPGSFVEWEFETEKNDIAFALYYKGKSDSKLKPVPLIPLQRVNAHMQIESGKFFCKKKGLYTLTLNNSYSWLRKKKIFCRVSVICSNEQIEAITY